MDFQKRILPTFMLNSFAPKTTDEASRVSPVPLCLAMGGWGCKKGYVKSEPHHIARERDLY
jgi:hypothetical protein